MNSRHPFSSPSQILNEFVAFEEQTFWDRVLKTPAEEVPGLMEDLHNTIHALGSQQLALQEWIRAILIVFKTRKVLPKSFFPLSPVVIDCDSHPIASGAIADIHHGTIGSLKFCVKRVHDFNEDTWLQEEAILWKHLRHPNIVSIVGATISPFQLVLEWMPGGNLMEYLEAHPNADRLGLLSGVAEALYYLHSHNIACGGIKGTSILTDGRGRACLADLALATVITDLEPSLSIRKHCSISWTAPEILGGEAGISKETDIFSLGMLIVEVYSGAAPFPNSTPTAAMVKIITGERPERPDNPALPDELWAIAQQCLEEDPQRRPEITDVVSCLKILATNQERPQLFGAIKASMVSKALCRVFDRLQQRWHGPRLRGAAPPQTRENSWHSTPGPRTLLEKARVCLLNLWMPRA